MPVVQKEDIRPFLAAGSFYPQDPQELTTQIDAMIHRAAKTQCEDEIKALVSPHAGYCYSGLVAAAGYRKLTGKRFSVVAVISPSHREAFPGASVFNGKGYLTPLGMVSIAKEHADNLIAQSERIQSSWRGHCEEHALEVQLPFAQQVIEDFSIVPIVMGEQSIATCEILGGALASILRDEQALIIASSDLSHHHSYETAREVDRRTIDMFVTFDESGIERAMEQGTCEACGAGAILSALIAAKTMGADRFTPLAYQNSGDTGAGRSAVVGYLSAAIS